MVIQTLSSKLALANLLEPDTLGHGAEVEVVGVLAVVAHLAEVSEVVLAYCQLLFALSWVSGEGRRRFEVESGGECVSIGAL